MSSSSSAHEALDGLLAGVPAEACLRLHKAWSIRVQPSWWGWRRRRIADAHLLLLRGGSGRYRIDGERVELRRGRMVLLWGPIPYDAEADAADPPDLLSFRFASYGRDGVMRPLPPMGFLTGDIGRGHPLTSLLGDLATRFRAGDAQGVCPSLLHHALVLVRELLASGQGDRRILRTIRMMEDTPGTIRTVGELARLNRLSVPHFTALFRRATGMPPRRYLAEARLHHARWLVEHSDQPLTAIAEELGFCDRFSFTRQFSRLHGIAPAACRRAAAGV